MFTSINTIQLPKLKVLNFKRNAIGVINDLQLPDSLEVLILKNQRCDLPLNYLTGLSKLPPRLRPLKLCRNGLSERTIQHLDISTSLRDLHMHDNAFENYGRWKEGVKLVYPGIILDFDGLSGSSKGESDSLDSDNDSTGSD
ncbi:hypothetical protein BABINDRAFT_163562, partial [Babjeviella inositovora NRRL Y-12698]